MQPELNILTTASVSMPSWPQEARAAVSMTFDVDAEAGPLGAALDASRPGQQRLGALSLGAFGGARGLERVLEVLSSYGVRATFYVPGLTAELRPDAVRTITSAGHEVGHHGFAHRRMSGLAVDQQRDEIEKGIAALEACSCKVRGYRAPGWEMPVDTLCLLSEFGFEYDSSLMSDDRPHRVSAGGIELLELPVHWALDDWPFFGFNGETGNFVDPRVPLQAWRNEFKNAEEEGRHVTYTMHPEVIGRATWISVLVELLSHLRSRGAAFLTHNELAKLIGAVDRKGGESE